MKFYDREEELGRLQDYWHSVEHVGKMVVLYGRRRIGKTTLIKKAFEGEEDFVYFFVARKDKGVLLRDFSEIFSRFLDRKGRVSGEFTTWDSFFSNIFSFAKKNRLAVVFDEFQNFHYVDRSVFSTLQNLWDSHRREVKVLLVCMGSYTGMMKKLFRDHREPLYGRVDRFINVKQFDFFSSAQMLRSFGVTDSEEQVRFYSALGGVPRYLEMVAEFPHRTYMDFISSLIKEGEYLKEEGERILASEFGRDYPSYFAVLEAISLGKATLKEIADWVHEPPTNVSRYLRDLTKGYEIVRRAVPITEDPRRSKKGRYFIRDNFYRLWFRYIYRNISHLEIGNYQHVIDEIRQENNAFVGKVYEEIWKRALMERSEASILPFSIELIGPWWHREEEIDLVAVNNKTRDILFCEVKWADRKTGPRVLEKLKEKAKRVKWKKENREEHYLIATKNGFTAKAKEAMENEGVIGYTLKDLADWVKMRNQE